MKQTGQVYAMKIMNKWDMLKRGEVRAGLSAVERGSLCLSPSSAPLLPGAGVVLPRRKGCVGERRPPLDHSAALRLPGRELPGEFLA